MDFLTLGKSVVKMTVGENVPSSFLHMDVNSMSMKIGNFVKKFGRELCTGMVRIIQTYENSNNTCIIWNTYQSLPQLAQKGGHPEIINRYIPVQYNLNDTEVCMTAIYDPECCTAPWRYVLCLANMSVKNVLCMFKQKQVGGFTVDALTKGPYFKIRTDEQCPNLGQG
jgi:hypothetical protein